MKKTFIIAIISFAFISRLFSFSIENQNNNTRTKFDKKNRFAFLVGIDNYDDSIGQFTACRIDALAFKGFLLSEQGYSIPHNNVYVGLDLEKEVFIDTFTYFLNKIDKPEESILYFYFSGHGSSEGLILADYTKDNPDKFLSYEWILKELSDKKIAKRIIIIDACESGGIIRRKSTALSDYMKKRNTSPSEVILTATTDNRATLAGTHYSIFTGTLLHILDTHNFDEGILTAGLLHQKLVKKLETINSPQFYGDKNFPFSGREPDVVPILKPKIEIESEIFKVVEDMPMPRFPDCENLEGGEGNITRDKPKLTQCSHEQLQKFIYDNLKYPELARSHSVEGMVVVRFIINEDGSVSDEEIVRDIGANCGEEVLRIVRIMPKWRPGKQKGRPVKVQVNYPVRFKL